MFLCLLRLAALLRLGSLLLVERLSKDLGPESAAAAGGVATFTWRALRGRVAYLSRVFWLRISWRACDRFSVLEGSPVATSVVGRLAIARLFTDGHRPSSRLGGATRLCDKLRGSDRRELPDLQLDDLNK